jgi:hypothetical protein
MSRRTLKPHGLSIGSGGPFHIFEGDNILDFASYISFEDFRYGEGVPFTTAHAKIRTPAVQMCWEEVRRPFPVIDLLDRWRTHSQPQPWFKRWLDKNTPGWAIDQPEADRRTDRTIFLQKRAHGLAIASLVAKHLGEIPSSIGPRRK